MLKKSYKLYWLIWLIDIALFLTIQLIAKYELIYKITFVFFLLFIFFVPLFLTSFSFYSHRLSYDNDFNKVAVIPFALAILSLLVSQIYFKNALIEDKRGLLLLITLIVFFVLLGLALVLKFVKPKEKWTLITIIFVILIYVSFLYYCKELSYYYSVLW